MGNSNAYCILTGRYSTLGEMTRVGTSRRRRDKPPLVPLSPAECRRMEFKDQLASLEHDLKTSINDLQRRTREFPDIIKSRDMGAIQCHREAIGNLNRRVDRLTFKITEIREEIEALT